MSAKREATAPGEVPLLVVSCDGYSDVWRPFFTLFWKRWPDCPFPVHLGSNFRTYDDPRVRSVAVGEDLSWATGVRSMLDRLDSEYVILFLEDFLLRSPVDTARVEELVRTGVRRGVGCLRLTRSRPPFDRAPVPLPDVPGVGTVPADHPYRVSTQVALWRTETLRRLLVPGFSAWDLELIGTHVSRELPEPFWEVLSSVLEYDHGVERGRWRPVGLEICREAGVEVDLAARRAFTPEEYGAHLRNYAELLRVYEEREDALSLFRRGRRIPGARRMMEVLRHDPTAAGAWATLLAGLGGRRTLDWLERGKLRFRVGRARSRYARALRERTAAET